MLKQISLSLLVRRQTPSLLKLHLEASRVPSVSTNIYSQEEGVWESPGGTSLHLLVVLLPKTEGDIFSLKI